MRAKTIASAGNNQAQTPQVPDAASATPAPARYTISDRHVAELLIGLNSFDPITRTTAVREIERLIHEPQNLMLVVQREAAVYRQRTLRGTLVSLAAVGAAVTFACLSPDPGAWYIVAGVALLMAGWLAVTIPSRARRGLISVLEQLTDARFLGAALTMLVPDGVTEVKTRITTNGVVRSSVTFAMKKMLPQIRADHQSLLTREQMQTLLALMRQQSRDPDLTVHILRALQQIGDESARSAVQALTRSHYWQVRRTAEETLEYLTLRAHEKQQSQTLLRASDAGNAVGQEQLLRPSNVTNAETAPEQLLRPQL